VPCVDRDPVSPALGALVSLAVTLIAYLGTALLVLPSPEGERRAVAVGAVGALALSWTLVCRRVGSIASITFFLRTGTRSPLVHAHTQTPILAASRGRSLSASWSPVTAATLAWDLSQRRSTRSSRPRCFCRAPSTWYRWGHIHPRIHRSPDTHAHTHTVALPISSPAGASEVTLLVRIRGIRGNPS
jgi:hypothetical protein